MIKILRSSSLLVLQRVTQRLIGVMSTIILARLLTPEDFGTVALAMLVLWFSQTLCDAGTEQYILQQKKITKNDLNSAWTLDLLLKSSAFLFMCLIAPFVAAFKSQPEITLIIWVTGLTIVIEALKNPILLIHKRRQRYGVIVRLTIYAKIASLFVSIPIALIYQSYWSIILSAVFAEIFLVVSTYKISAYRPNLCFIKVPEQWKFSKWLIPRSVLGYLRNHLDTLLVSGAYNKSELGAYNNMKYFASIPMLQFLSPLVEPLHVELGKVGHDKNEFKYQSDITFKILAIVSSTMIAFLYISAEPIVKVILGSQWTSFSTLFSYFVLLTVPFVLINQSFRILMVSNKTNLIFTYEIISTVVIGLCLVFSFRLSLESFILVKFFAETLLAIGLYSFSYRKATNATPIKNIIYLLSLTALNIFFLEWLGTFYPNIANPMLLTIVNGVCSAILLTILFILFYHFFTTIREKTLLRKMIRPIVSH